MAKVASAVPKPDRRQKPSLVGGELVRERERESTIHPTGLVSKEENQISGSIDRETWTDETEAI